jgi:amino acid adenylation domain-containing protein
LWFLAQLQPGSTAYHISGGLRIDGRLDLRAVGSAFQALTERHAQLRTRFATIDGKPMQIAQTGVHAPLTRIAVDAAQMGQAPELVNAPFDIEAGPSWRAVLCSCGTDKHALWLSLHHILADGWSVGRLLAEFAELYAAALQGSEPNLPNLAIEYADYAVWQRQWLAAGEADRQLNYWRRQLGGEQPTLALPFDRPRPERLSGAGASHRSVMPTAVGAAVKRLALANDTTPFVVLLTAFSALLYRYSGQSDVRIGVPVANRQRLETEAVIGFFVNTLVIKAECRGDWNFSQSLQRLKQTVLQAQEHPDLPFEHLVEALQPQRALNRNPLFQVMFNHQKRDFQALQTLPGLAIHRIELDGAGAQFDLSLATEEDPDGNFSARWVYAADLFAAETIARLAGHFLNLLGGWTQTPDSPLAALALLSPAELARQSACNATETAYPAGFVPQWLSQAAARQPWAPALALGEAELSYAELEARSNRLAHWLIARGVGPETPVGIGALRSFELVLGILAVVKAGGAYVPLDPDYPDQRLAYMMLDSGVGMLLSHGAVLDRFSALCPGACAVYDLDSLDLSGQAETAPAVALHPAHPAYIIYTSGSTGRPKGAANSHAALANRLHWMQQAYAIGPGDTVLQKTPFSFDVSVWEFFWPLMTGARLALAQPGAHRDPPALTTALHAYQVSTVHFVPSMLAEFVNQSQLPHLPALKRIVCSGEALPAELQQRVFERLPGVDLVNLYGPTEAAIDVTHWTCRAEPGPVPIGRPIANLQIQILDSDLNPLPAGVAGELYIGGLGLARGYYRKAGLTAERFLPDPFGSGGRLYRSGDLARRRADGAIDYLGRIDQQIKLRGLRIELGEIETALLQQTGVAEAAVLLQDAAGGPRLVAYIAATEQAGGDAELRLALSRQLPDYMLPAALIRLDSLPKTANGKLDRKALPQAHWQGQVYRAPQSDTERRLAAIWQELLDVEPVGLDDNFFALGGHSLLATRLVARIRAELGTDLPLLAVFETQSLRDLAALLGTAAGSAELGEQALAEMGDWLDDLELS